MKVLEFGSTFQKRDTFSYLSKKTMLEYDMIIIDIDNIIRETYDNTPKQYMLRKAELEEFIRFKNIPIVYITPSSHSAQIVINGHLNTVGLNYFLPILEVRVELKEGKDIETIGNSPLAKFALHYKEQFLYKSYFQTRYGSTFIQTPFSNLPLAFWDKESVFLPPLKVSIKTVEKDFFNDLYAAIISIRQTPSSELPAWTEHYLVPNEQTVKEEISSIEQQIQQLTEKQESKNIELSTLSRHKALFTASGSELEKLVEGILVELGFEILEAEEGREDLIVKYEDKVAVIEVKGLTGSSGEKNAAQLEKWVSTYLEKTGNQPKPILIVNAYREKPLKDRNETNSPTFPHQMLKYSNNREHCLVTTLQLLGVYYHVKNNPTDKQSIIEKMLSTVGKFEMFEDWNSFITVQS